MTYYVILPRSMDGDAVIVGQSATYDGAVALVDRHSEASKGWHVRQSFEITQALPRLPAERPDRTVLRTVFMPFEMDEELKTLAFRADMSRNDIMVAAIRTALEGLKDGTLKINARGKIVQVRKASA